MDKEIEDIASKLEVVIRRDPDLRKNGYYLASINMIVINSSLSEFEQKKVLLHELAHASDHKKEIELYNRAYSLHSKMEYEAECFVVRFLLNEYLTQSSIEPSEVNYISFLESYRIDTRFESYVRGLLICYSMHSKST